MKWSTKAAFDKRLAKINAVYKWHRWFAWYPVMDRYRNWYWLCNVDRKAERGYSGNVWSYREFVDFTGSYYVETVTGLRCLGTVIDSREREVKFKLDSEKEGYWMPEHLVYKTYGDV